jgi:hypothetical protein
MPACCSEHEYCELYDRELYELTRSSPTSSCDLPVLNNYLLDRARSEGGDQAALGGSRRRSCDAGAEPRSLLNEEREILRRAPSTSGSAHGGLEERERQDPDLGSEHRSSSYDGVSCLVSASQRAGCLRRRKPTSERDAEKIRQQRSAALLEKEA